MKMQKISDKVKPVSRIGIGCMRLTELAGEEVRAMIENALSCGINFFDHADIYADGRSEELFGRVMTPALRDQLVIQTKCGIRPGICYDLTREHILASVDQSLKRLNCEYIDLLLLHRPDPLMEPEEIAAAFEKLYQSGKVRAFGVSNMNPMQIELINQACGNQICVDQIQFSLAHCPGIDSGINVNIENDAGCSRDGGIIEYARLKKITLQAWSPFQYGSFEGTFIGSEKYPELNAELNRLAKKYEASPNAIAAAWILRHPAGIQTIVGSMNEKRIRNICRAADIELTREEWYALYLAAGKQLP